MKKFLLLAVAVMTVAAASAQAVSRKSVDSKNAMAQGPTIANATVQVAPTVEEPILLPESMIASANPESKALMGEKLDMSAAEFTLVNDISINRSKIKAVSLWESYMGSGTDYRTVSSTTWTMYPATATNSSTNEQVDVLVDVVPNYFSTSLDNIPLTYSISDNTLTIEPQYFATTTYGSYGTCYVFFFEGAVTDDGVVTMTAADDGTLTVSSSAYLMYGLFTTSTFDSSFTSASSGGTYLGYYQITYGVEYLEPGTVVTPEAMAEPQGLWINAWANDAGYSYNYPHSMIPAYSDNTVKNYTSSTVTGYEWSLPEYTYSSESAAYETSSTLTSTDTDAVFSVTSGYYGSPTLTAINETVSDSYTYGWGNYNYTSNNALTFAGASTSNWTMTTGSNPVVGKANLDYGWVIYTNFGTPDIYTSSSYGGVATQIFYQGIPDAPLYIEGVTMLLQGFSESSDGISLTCQIVKATRSSSGTLTLGDVIAESTTISYVTNSYTTLTFSDFYVYDEDGLTVGIDHLFIEDEFAIVVDGWNNGTFSTYMMSEYCNDSSNLPSYYFYYENSTSMYYLTFTNHVIVGFDATYGFLYTEDSTTFEFDAEGGSKQISIYPYLCSVDSDGSYTTRLFLEDDSEIPDWLEVGYANEDYSDGWGFDLVVTAEALPSGTDSRTGTFRLYQEGAYLDITVTQTEDSGISTTVADASGASAYVDGDNIVISGAQGAELYSVAGQKVGEGETSIDASALSSGVYIVKLSDGSAVKVVK